jgi:hypothetical protein
MEKLKEAIRIFLRSTGHTGYPYLRYYIRAFETEARKTHSKEEVEDAVKTAIDEVAKELNIDAWLV